MSTDLLSAAEIEVAAALSEMAIGRGGQLDDTQTAVYLRGLADLAAGLVVRVCRAYEREPRDDYGLAIPSVGEIRARVGELREADEVAAATAKLLPMPASRSDEPTYFCLSCHDEPNGWQPCWCPGDGAARHVMPPEAVQTTRVAPCGRRGRGHDHEPHTYVDRCPCVDTNPVIARHRERQRAYRQRTEAAKQQR